MSEKSRQRAGVNSKKQKARDPRAERAFRHLRRQAREEGDIDRGRTEPASSMFAREW